MRTRRPRSAVRLAEALDSAECSMPMEMIFVLDGCTDNTREALEACDLAGPLKIAEAPGLGAAAARNKGVAQAGGDELLFMDDDVVPRPGALEAHVRSLAWGKRLAVVGPYPYAPEMPVNPIDFFVRDWWNMRFKALADPAHTFTYADCLTGNLSLSRADFEAVGGFDEAFQKDGREDYELGVRLLKSGVRICFAKDALAYHYPVNRPRSVLRKWYTFGRADVYFAQKHPEVFWTLPIRRYCRNTPSLRAGLHALALCLPVNPLGIVSLIGGYFEKRLDRLWEDRWLRRWRLSHRLAYLLGVLSALGGVRQFDDFVRRWQDRADWPRRRVRIEDVDILSGQPPIGGLDACDGLFLLPRVEGFITAWVEAPCESGRDSLSSAEIAECLSRQASWPIWRSLAASDGSNAPLSDYAAWLEIRERLGTVPSRDGDVHRGGFPSDGSRHSHHLSAVIFSNDAAPPSSESPPFEPDRLVCFDGEGGRLRPKLKAALSACSGEFVALLKSSDRVDAGWANAVFRHFANPQVACVVTPVILRSVQSRAEELYQALAGFDRVASWEFAWLTDWLLPAYVLNEFNAACHRLVVSKCALDLVWESLAGSSQGYEEAALRILHALLHKYEKVVYEPRAVIWRDSPVYMPDVRSMSAEHCYLIHRILSEHLVSSHAGRLRSLHILRKLLRLRVRTLLECARGCIDWPLSFAVAEAVAAARGIKRGIAGRPEEDASPPVSVTQKEGVTWVS